MGLQHDKRDRGSESHAALPRDETPKHSEINGGSRKPILVRILLAWERAQRRKTEEFIGRHKHFNSFY